MSSEGTREKRSYDPIVHFNNGFSIGWKMAVPESFKEALDIRLTARTIKGATKMHWTQGRMYEFKEGDQLHDTRLAITDWQSALLRLQLSVQVKEASAVQYFITGERDEKGRSLYRRDPGSVKFASFRPNQERTAVIESGTYICTQDSFVEFLRTGNVLTLENEDVDLFNRPSSSANDERSLLDF